MTSSSAPAFEGFSSSFVDDSKQSPFQQRKRSRSVVVPDSASVHSTSSNSSFATLRKMSKSLFTKTSSSDLKRAAAPSPHAPANLTPATKVTPENYSSIPNNPPKHSSSSPNNTLLPPSKLDPKFVLAKPEPTFYIQDSPSDSPGTSRESSQFSFAPFLENSPASTSVSHAVAEADKPVSTPGDTAINALASVTIPNSQSTNSFDFSDLAEGLGQLVSATSEDLTTAPTFYNGNSSSRGDDTNDQPAPPEEESSEDDLNAADTVFPRNLDNITVETIRSSLERTKSLERRRSRRSTRSTRSNKSGKSSAARSQEVTDSIDGVLHSRSGSELLPNALEIHATPDLRSEPSHDAATPKKSILKKDEPAVTSRPSSARSIRNTRSKPPPNTPPLGPVTSPRFYSTNPASRDHKLSSSPSMNSMFNFGDIDLNLDFEFGTTDFSSHLSPVQKLRHSRTPSNVSSVSSISSQPGAVHHYAHPLYTRQNSSTSAVSTSSSASLSPQLVAVSNGHVTNSSQTSIKYHSASPQSSPQLYAQSQRMAHGNKHSSTSPAPSSHVSFSSKIIIFDTYDPTDYDRRAEPATCNRLTPLLAQQIKEELNNFKMEMSVHAESRIYTHFF